MGRENIEKYSSGYALLKHLAGTWHDNIFYRKIIVLGRENINPDDHLIFAPNHQNALMDALAVLFTLKGQPVFLARADIFKRKLVASLLYFLKILPVYRIRDGYSSLKENEDIFNKTIDVIKNKNGLIILPEGDHAGFRRLRQLKKGICRVAFQADEASDFSLKIKIIPVGIEYSNYTRVRQVLSVVYGKPVEVSEYHQLYRENPEKALLELRNRLSSEMKRIMVHIDSVDDYEAIDELRSIINGKYSDDIRFPKLFRDRILIEKVNRSRSEEPKKYKSICSLSLKVKNKTHELDLDYRLLEKKRHSPVWLAAGIGFLIATFPLFLFGSIFTLTFLTLPEIQTRKIKDAQFHSSFKYVISLFMALVISPLYLILAFLFFTPIWLALALFMVIPVAGIFAWNYRILLRRITGGFRIRKYISEKNPEYITLMKDYKELTDLVSSLKDEKR